MRVLVTFALDNEFAPWRDMRKFRSGRWGGATLQITEIDGVEVGVVLTGVGPRQAELESSKVRWAEGDSTSFCITSGLAGALRPEYQIGQVLAARTVLSESLRPEGESQLMESSAVLLSFASECGATVADRFYSANHVITSAQGKLLLESNADAIEMESFEVMRVAKASGIPAISIRAISDNHDEDLPLDMNQILSDDGRVSIPRVLGQVALHPRSFPGLMKLGQQTRKATEALARFLDRYVAKIAESAKSLEVRAAAQ